MGPGNKLSPAALLGGWSAVRHFEVKNRERRNSWIFEFPVDRSERSEAEVPKREIVTKK